MIQPATLPLVGNRWTPLVYTIQVTGADLSAATFKAQVRLLPGTSGTPLVDLATAALGAEGISCTSATVGADTVSTITLRVNQSTMSGLPVAPATGDDVTLYWDMHVTRTGFSKAVYFRGPFTVLAGVTQ